MAHNTSEVFNENGNSAVYDEAFNHSNFKDYICKDVELNEARKFIHDKISKNLNANSSKKTDAGRFHNQYNKPGKLCDQRNGKRAAYATNNSAEDVTKSNKNGTNKNSGNVNNGMNKGFKNFHMNACNNVYAECPKFGNFENIMNLPNDFKRYNDKMMNGNGVNVNEMNGILDQYIFDKSNFLKPDVYPDMNGNLGVNKKGVYDRFVNGSSSTMISEGGKNKTYRNMDKNGVAKHGFDSRRGINCYEPSSSSSSNNYNGNCNNGTNGNFNELKGVFNGWGEKPQDNITECPTMLMNEFNISSGPYGMNNQNKMMDQHGNGLGSACVPGMNGYNKGRGGKGEGSNYKTNTNATFHADHSNGKMNNGNNNSTNNFDNTNNGHIHRTSNTYNESNKGKHADKQQNNNGEHKHNRTGSSNHPEKEEENIIKLFFGNLAPITTEKDMYNVFTPYGRCSSLIILKDRRSKSRGSGFVTFYDQNEAINAIKCLNNKITLPGAHKPLEVRFPEDKSERQLRTKLLSVAKCKGEKIPPSGCLLVDTEDVLIKKTNSGQLLNNWNNFNENRSNIQAKKENSLCDTNSISTNISNGINNGVNSGTADGITNSINKGSGSNNNSNANNNNNNNSINSNNNNNNNNNNNSNNNNNNSNNINNNNKNNNNNNNNKNSNNINSSNNNSINTATVVSNATTAPTPTPATTNNNNFNSNNGSNNANITPNSITNSTNDYNANNGSRSVVGSRNSDLSSASFFNGADYLFETSKLVGDTATDALNTNYYGRMQTEELMYAEIAQNGEKENTEDKNIVLSNEECDILLPKFLIDTISGNKESVDSVGDTTKFDEINIENKIRRNVFSPNEVNLPVVPMDAKPDELFSGEDDDLIHNCSSVGNNSVVNTNGYNKNSRRASNAASSNNTNHGGNNSNDMLSVTRNKNNYDMDDSSFFSYFSMNMKDDRANENFKFSGSAFDVISGKNDFNSMCHYDLFDTNDNNDYGMKGLQKVDRNSLDHLCHNGNNVGKSSFKYDRYDIFNAHDLGFNLFHLINKNDDCLANQMVGAVENDATVHTSSTHINSDNNMNGTNTHNSLHSSVFNDGSASSSRVSPNGRMMDKRSRNSDLTRGEPLAEIQPAQNDNAFASLNTAERMHDGRLNVSTTTDDYNMKMDTNGNIIDDMLKNIINLYTKNKASIFASHMCKYLSTVLCEINNSLEVFDECNAKNTINGLNSGGELMN